jgi:hypothetical protein
MKTDCWEAVEEMAGTETVRRRLGVLAACVAARMEERIETLASAGSENLGHLEEQLAKDGQELLRQAEELGEAATGTCAGAREIVRTHWPKRVSSKISGLAGSPQKMCPSRGRMARSPPPAAGSYR